jgi:hypothetical protein
MVNSDDDDSSDDDDDEEIPLRLFVPPTVEATVSEEVASNPDDDDSSDDDDDNEIPYNDDDDKMGTLPTTPSPPTNALKQREIAFPSNLPAWENKEGIYAFCTTEVQNVLWELASQEFGGVSSNRIGSQREKKSCTGNCAHYTIVPTTMTTSAHSALVLFQTTRQKRRRFLTESLIMITHLFMQRTVP